MAGLGYSGRARRSGGSGRTAGGRVTAASVSRARSNTGCAAAAVAAAGVALLHSGQYADKQIVATTIQDDGPGQVRARQGSARLRHRVTKSRRVPPVAVTGRPDVITYWALPADIPRA